MAILLTDDLRQQYQSLFSGCVIAPAHLPAVDPLIPKIAAGQARYHAVGDPMNVPWYFIGLIHLMEGSLNFNTHLHNGDPLTARTVHAPPGRPPAGDPPFTWEQSATDSLQYQGLDKVKDWSLPGLLYQLEKYNGFGYRGLKPPINTPYLWSYSNQYTSGKYVADRQFDPNAVSKQCGAAVVLLRMVQQNVVQLPAAAGAPAPAAPAGS